MTSSLPVRPPTVPLRSIVLLTSLCATVALLAVGSAAATERETWPGFRGPSQGELPDTGLSLERAWVKPLGSGYSGIVAADGKIVTMFTSGADDVLAALDGTSGEELWRVRLAEKYAGHDSSDDGPLGVPAIDGDTVYALGPRGQLVAVGLADGTEHWRVQLDEANSTEPFFGYTTSPLVEGDLLILATGGEGHAVTAFDRATGEVRWRRGDDSVQYQTPAITELAGRRQIVAVTDRMILGLSPEDGEELWSLTIAEGSRTESSAHPTPAGDDRVLIDLQNESMMLEITRDGDSYSAEELWRSRAFGRSLVLPVVHEGHVYGFTGNFLTCADAATGEIVWRSRPPGGFNLSLVDGHLAVVDPKGELVLAEASPAGYSEVARVAALDVGDYASPTYVDGRFFVRNLSQIAAVEVRSSGSRDQPVRRAGDATVDGEIAALVAELEALDEGERQARVDAFFADREPGPLVGDDGTVHFVWRGDADDVGLAGFGESLRDEETMHHVDGTDLFVLSKRLDPRAVYEYAYIVDFGRPGPDPHAARTMDYGFMKLSELRMPQWPDAPHLEPPGEDAPRGELDGFQFRSEILDNTRRIQLWTPPGYDRSGASYPLLIVSGGDEWLSYGSLENTLDRLVGDPQAATVAPLVAIFVPRAANGEFGGTTTADYARFLVEELIPHLETHYRLTDERALLGSGRAGASSAYALFAHPDTFDALAVQSFVFRDKRDELTSMIGSGEADTRRVLIEVRENDQASRRSGIDAARESRALAEALDAAGHDVDVVELPGVAGWPDWRGRSDELLAWLFPASDSGDSPGAR